MTANTRALPVRCEHSQLKTPADCLFRQKTPRRPSCERRPFNLCLRRLGSCCLPPTCCAELSLCTNPQCRCCLSVFWDVLSSTWMRPTPLLSAPGWLREPFAPRLLAEGGRGPSQPPLAEGKCESGPLLAAHMQQNAAVKQAAQRCVRACVRARQICVSEKPRCTRAVVSPTVGPPSCFPRLPRSPRSGVAVLWPREALCRSPACLTRENTSVWATQLNTAPPLGT